MAVVVIPKTDAEHTIFPCWVPVVTYKDNKRLKPNIRCKCGKYCGIGLHHVHANGKVTASFYHKALPEQPKNHKGCGWHVYLQLKDYDWGDYPPRKK